MLPKSVSKVHLDRGVREERTSECQRKLGENSARKSGLPSPV
jgi:hypothetical protein